MIELFLSSDGKHTVHVAAETPEEMTALLPQAKLLYEAVVHAYGTKAQLWQRSTKGQTEGGRQEAQTEAEAPICPIHSRPMAYRQGRRGAFWSCPTRTEDGSWCSYTVDASQPTNGHAGVAA